MFSDRQLDETVADPSVATAAKDTTHARDNEGDVGMGPATPQTIPPRDMVDADEADLFAECEEEPPGPKRRAISFSVAGWI